MIAVPIIRKPLFSNISTTMKTVTITYFKYFKHDVNQGKGAAIHTGIAQATGEYLLVQDADLEYDPGEYNTLLKPIVLRLGRCGIRFTIYRRQSTPHPLLLAFNRQLSCLPFFSNMFSNLNLTDMETGYKLFRTDYHSTYLLTRKTVWV